MSRVLKVGVVGTGYWGPNLVRNFARQPDCEVAAVCDMRYERALRVGAEFRVPLITDRVEQLLDDPGLDLVILATPAHTHYPLAKRALTNGKHVLVMKPLTTSTAHAEELCDLARDKGVLLAVDHTFVFTPSVQKVRELVRSGDLGDLYYFDSVRVNLGLFQSDINVLWDLAPHDISILDYVVGGTPADVMAVGVAHAGSPKENIAYITMRYANSFLAHVHVNWLAPAKVRRTIVGGSLKMLVYDDAEPTEKIKIYDKGVSIQTNGHSNGTGSDPYELLVSYRTGDMLAPRLSTKEALAVEAENIIRAIRGIDSLQSDGHAGLRVVRILEAAQTSIAENGRPVRLHLDRPAATPAVAPAVRP